ncbi:hypothetical protein CAPTEDRAFT_189021 [Capitella teleta]|uniref:Uncharacterized protein n=1 Tax=Capitella teleta TaxID=283909 RepID=R7UKT1_CAPTE|nr:hypothetical protein CAPTEDRAFT_189021 [Capitella teleta]|eukprot:ELU07124.1 hypothetical protein CAPTEDRAFT_189021 [Capitella teleta]
MAPYTRSPYTVCQSRKRGINVDDIERLRCRARHTCEMDSRTAAAAAADYMAGVERSLFMQAAGLMTPPHAVGSTNAALFSPPLGDTASAMHGPAPPQPPTVHSNRYLPHMNAGAGRTVGSMVGAYGAELSSPGGPLSGGPSSSEQLKNYYSGLSSQFWASMHPMSAAGHREIYQFSCRIENVVKKPPPRVISADKHRTQIARMIH